MEPLDEKHAELDFEALMSCRARLREELQWVHRAWPINRVLIPLREANTRGIAIARQCRLVAWDRIEEGPLSDHRCFLS